MRVAVQNQLIAEGGRVSDVISSSTGTMAIEQATSECQAFEGACVLNAPTWHQADHELMGLKQWRNDLDKSFGDQVAAFNFVGTSERMEELEASSVPNRKEQLSIMLRCVVESVRSKLSFTDSELGAASIVTQNVVQLRKASADVGPTLHRGGLIDLEAATQKLQCCVVEHFNKLLGEFELTLNSQNLLAIAIQRVVVTVYCSEAHGMEAVSGWRVEVRLYKKDISESDSTPGLLISAFVKKPPHWCTQRCRRNLFDIGKDASGDRRLRLRADTLAVSRGGAGDCAEVSQPFSGGRGSQVSQRCHGAGTPTAPSQSVNGFRFGAAEDAGAAGELRTNFAERLDVEGRHRSDVVS